MAKIGFLGGTFNPIHNGHLKLAENAYNQLNLDKVLIVPSGISYLKENAGVLSKEIRADMTKLAIENVSYCVFSDIEIKREGNTYTYETLEELNKIYPDDDIYFLIGADTLFNLESWKFPDIIFKKCIISVMTRDDSNIDDIIKQSDVFRNKYSANIEILNVDKIDISSTRIRELISNKCYDEVRDIIPAKVLKYIIDNNLYTR